MDPGWKPAIKRSWRAVLPGKLQLAARDSVLLGARAIVLAALFQWTAYGVILSFIDASDWRVTPAMGAVAAFGAVNVALVAYLTRRPLNLTDVARVRSSFMTRYFLTYALANAAVLGGFVAFFVSKEGRMPAYLTGIPFGLMALVVGGPTKGNLARDQDRIRATGAPISLLEVLSSGPST